MVEALDKGHDTRVVICGDQRLAQRIVVLRRGRHGLETEGADDRTV